MDSGSTLTVSGNAEISGGDFGITGNGLKKSWGTSITINGGTITGNWGIYHPQTGDLTIINGNIIGEHTGLEIRSGNLYVKGGNIVGKGLFSAEGNDNGCTVEGVGVAVSQHTTDQDIAVTTVSGGTIKGGKYALFEEDMQNEESSNIHLLINGGLFEINPEEVDKTDAAVVSSENVIKFISGGKFSTAPLDDYLADGRVSQLNSEDGYYYVPYFVSFGEDAYTVAGMTEPYTITSAETKTFTITPNSGKKLTNVEATNATITDNGSGTYALSEAKGDVKVTVTLEDVYAISFTGEGYTVSGMTEPYTIAASETKTFTIALDTGKKLTEEVTATGADLKYSDGTYTLSGATSTVTITVALEDLPAGENAPEISTEVKKDNTGAVTITPSTGTTIEVEYESTPTTTAEGTTGKANTVTIVENGIPITTTYATPVTTTTKTDGTVIVNNDKNVVATTVYPYPETLVETTDETTESVTYKLELTYNGDHTVISNNLPKITSTLNEDTIAKNTNKFDDAKPFAMISAAAPDGTDMNKINAVVTQVKLTFTVPKAVFVDEYNKDTSKFSVLHVKSNGDYDILIPGENAWTELDNGDWEFFVIGDGFSDYISLVGVPPVKSVVTTSSSSSGSSVWLQESAIPTETPTQQPTDKPTDTVPTDIPVTQPTATPASPGFGILAALAGLGAVAALRRQ